MNLHILNNKLHLLVLVLLIAVSLLVFPDTTNADMGPKPSVNIDIKGSENIAPVYFVTLLAETSGNGPYSADDDRYGYSAKEEYRVAYAAFYDYAETDDFYFWGELWKCEGDTSVSWGYYPPEVFKVLVYNPETGRILSSDINERYAFDSYFLLDMTSADSFSFAKDEELVALLLRQQIMHYVAAFLIRLVCCLAIEMGLAVLFGIRSKKQLLVILLTNVTTQITLNAMLNWFGSYRGFAWIVQYILLELMIFFFEAILYTILLPRLAEPRIKAWLCFLYALLANLLSFAAGSFVFTLTLAV